MNRAQSTAKKVLDFSPLQVDNQHRRTPTRGNAVRHLSSVDPADRFDQTTDPGNARYTLTVTFDATDVTQAGMLANMAVIELEKWETEIGTVVLRDNFA